MVRRLSLAFVFFGTVSAVAHAATAEQVQCMFRCGSISSTTLQECNYICGISETTKVIR